MHLLKRTYSSTSFGSAQRSLLIDMTLLPQRAAHSFPLLDPSLVPLCLFFSPHCTFHFLTCYKTYLFTVYLLFLVRLCWNASSVWTSPLSEARYSSFRVQSGPSFSLGSGLHLFCLLLIAHGVHFFLSHAFQGWIGLLLSSSISYVFRGKGIISHWKLSNSAIAQWQP